MEFKNPGKEGENKISKQFFLEQMRAIFNTNPDDEIEKEKNSSKELLLNPNLEKVYEKIFRRFKVQKCEIKYHVTAKLDGDKNERQEKAEKGDKGILTLILR